MPQVCHEALPLPTTESVGFRERETPGRPEAKARRGQQLPCGRRQLPPTGGEWKLATQIINTHFLFEHFYDPPSSQMQ